MFIKFKDSNIFIHSGNPNHDLFGHSQKIILVHGAGCDHTSWAGQVRHLAHRVAPTFALDLPQHGKSDGPNLQSIEAMADWLKDLCLEITPDPKGGTSAKKSSIMLVGHSMGSYVVLEAAKKLGTAVSALVLIGTAEKMPTHPALLDAAFNNLSKAADMVCNWGHNSTGAMGGNEALGVWMIGAAHRLISNSRPNILGYDFQACASYNPIPAIKSLSCPILTIAGRDDMMTPLKSAKALLAHLPPEVPKFWAELNNCGHMIMSEKPHDTRQLLADFSRKHLG